MLDQQQQDAYAQDGFVVVPGLVDAARMRVMAQEVEDLHERMHRGVPDGVDVAWEASGHRIRQLMHADRVVPSIAEFVADSELRAIIGQLMGPSVELFHAKLLMKAARDGSITPWHQDWGYWRRGSQRPVQVNCMLAIDDADPDNGCLRMRPGSHKDGPREHQRDPTAGAFNQGLESGFALAGSVPVPMRRGDAVFFGALVVHGSQANTSDRDRRALTCAFDVPGNARR